jgi:hypothetical protein
LILYLKHHEIDPEKWDRCIAGAANGLPYARAWWLDLVSRGWEALVEGDYVAVMPLTCRRKYGFDMLSHPYFTQQLGVFSPNTLSPEEISHFLEAIPGHFKYIQIQLNASNCASHAGFRYTLRNNYTLSLSPAYVDLLASYHRNCRRNLQKAIQTGLKIKPGPGAPAFVHFVERNLEKKQMQIDRNLYPVLRQLVSESLQRGIGEIIGVYKPTGELVAAGWFVTEQGRCLFEVCASTGEGKDKQAMFLLIDHVVQQKSGSPMILDFTGSDIPGVAYFNAGFGASKSAYLVVKKNKLPMLLRVFKR